MDGFEGISIVFPAFNEEENIERAIAKAIEVFDGKFSSLEIIPVDDGSSDDTGNIIDRLAGMDSRVHPVHHPANRGYGAALKSGFQAASNELLFFTDADNQFDMDEADLLLSAIGQADMVIGYRIKRRDHPVRSLNALLYKTLIRLLFGLAVRDIDCAFKLFRRDILDGMTLEADGALLSAELLIKAGRAGRSIIEVGVHHYPRMAGNQTGANLRVILKAFREIFRFYHQLRCKQVI